MSLGESILDHYELFLGKYIGVDKYTSGEYVIQLLGFDRTFKDCLTFASLGLSNYSNLINNSCEVIMPVDDDYDNCAVVFANALFYVLQQQMDFGRAPIESPLTGAFYMGKTKRTSSRPHDALETEQIMRATSRTEDSFDVALHTLTPPGRSSPARRSQRACTTHCSPDRSRCPCARSASPA